MADFKISGGMKVKTLKANFKKEFGSTLRVYNGNKFADDDDTVGKIAKKTVKRGEDVSANGRKLVSTFEKQIGDIYGIRIQIASKDDSNLVDNDITLTESGKN
jgi:hypothetical protein